MNDRKARDVAALATQHLREMQDLLGGGSLAEARAQFLELYTWVPECADKAVLKAYEENGAKKGEVPPFFSEVYAYEVFGKEEARTLLALMGKMGEVLGLTWKDLRAATNQKIREGEGREGPKAPHKDEPFGSEDFDALELMIRRDGTHYYDGPQEQVQVQRALRAINAAREVFSAPHNPEWKYMKVRPKDLQIGDEIVRRGTWVQVLGFFHDEKEKRWTDEGPTFSEVPVGSEELDFRGEPRTYCVKTNWSPRMGEDLGALEEVAIRRRRSPEENALSVG